MSNTMIQTNGNVHDEHRKLDQYLTFLLGKDEFAISLCNVKEILEYYAPTSVPKMPDFVHGAINLRGKVVPVVDLTNRLYHSQKASITTRTCIVIAELKVDEKWINIGLLVDSVSKVIKIDNANIEAAPALGSAVDVDFIQGMGKISDRENDRFIIILNVDKILSMDDLEKLSDTTTDED